jgi:hypothetical protein
MFASLEEAARMRGAVQCFRPQIGEPARQERLARWREALDGSLRG